MGIMAPKVSRGMKTNKRINVNRLQKEMKSQLLYSGAGFVGFADISDLRFPDNAEWRIAISIGLPYDSKIVDTLDLEIDVFEKHLQETYESVENLLKVCEHYLRQEGFITQIHFAKNLAGLLSTFSHKMAATEAGLGWIGKSSLFVSTKFGCRVRLATVLTNASFTPGIPVTESQCGDCVECVKACPYQAIKGATWYPGIERDELLDAFLCDRIRNEYIPKLGYKHPCGLCVKACPVGNEKG